MRPCRPLTLLLALAVTACGGSGGSGDDDASGDGDGDGDTATRAFHLGFTPWPWAGTQAAVDDTYTRIQAHGDLVAHHVMDGVPWDEALAGGPYPVPVEEAIDARLAQTRDGQAIYLALDAVNAGRDGLADDWDDGCGDPLCAPWNGYAFSEPDVVTAYTNFALHAIDRFRPDFLNIASEASELLLNDADDGTNNFPAFVDFAGQVTAAIRDQHPELPLMISVALKDPGSSAMADLVAGLAPLIDHVDIVGISVYPYAFYEQSDRGDPDALPADWLDQVESLSQGKPLAVTETGWVGEDLSIAAFGLEVDSDPARQNAYVERLLAGAEALDARFVVWFTVADYDQLWANELMGSDLGKIWKDTGLFDGSLQPRPALTTWDAWLDRARE